MAMPGLLLSSYSRFSEVFMSVISSLPSLFAYDSVSFLYNYYFNTLVNSFNGFNVVETQSEELTSTSASVASRSVSELSSTGLGENLNDQRFMRFMNPVFKYDFKVGNYLPDDAKKLNPHLFMTIKDLTTGIRKSS
jgi:hypothetical protein